jgi:hypothetical protein
MGILVMPFVPFNLKTRLQIVSNNSKVYPSITETILVHLAGPRSE